MNRIAIIGAGMAGLALAQSLRGKAECMLFEKSRGVGGRMATRRIGDYAFDHGACFFTARSLAFRRFLQPHRASGIVQDWNPRVLTLASGEKSYRRDWFEPHYVAVPGMTALCKAMAEGLDVQTGAKVTQLLQQADGRWALDLSTDNSSTAATADEPFDWVVCTAPAPQARELLPAGFCHHEQLAQVQLEPCMVLLLGLEEAPGWRFGAARIKHPVLDWITCEATRPGRGAAAAVVLHSTAAWAAQQPMASDDEVAATMLQALEDVLGQPLPPHETMQLKRWTYALASTPERPLLLLDEELRLAVCGDWTHAGRVEGAFLSARALAQALETYL
jgi:renalase